MYDNTPGAPPAWGYLMRSLLTLACRIMQGPIQDFFHGGVSWHNMPEKYLGSIGGSYGGGFGGLPQEIFEYEVL